MRSLRVQLAAGLVQRIQDGFVHISVALSEMTERLGSAGTVDRDAYVRHLQHSGQFSYLAPTERILKGLKQKL